MTRTINVVNTDVDIVASHEKAIHSWAKTAQRIGKSVNLITLDRHLDTMSAFNKTLCSKYGEVAVSRINSLSRERCEEVGLKDGQAPLDASLDLSNEEHIDAAIVAGIINYAFVISLNEGNPCRRKKKANVCEEVDFMFENNLTDPPENCPFAAFDLPSSRIVELEPTCAADCEELDHFYCTRRQADAALESSYLAPKIHDIIEIGQLAGIDNVLDQPFILDIDLDYFRSKRAISPHNPDEFYRLVNGAAAITIATSPFYVTTGSLSGENLSVAFLEKRLLEHIYQALGETGLKKV